MLELAIFIPSIKQIFHLGYLDTLIKLDEIEYKIISSRYPLVNNEELINKINIYPNRIYFGNEFCEKTIPLWQDIKKALQKAKEKKVKIYFCYSICY